MTVYTFGEIKYDSERNTDSPRGFLALMAISCAIFWCYFLGMFYTSGGIQVKVDIKTEITYLKRIMLILGFWISIFSLIICIFSIYFHNMLENIEKKKKNLLKMKPN